MLNTERHVYIINKYTHLLPLFCRQIIVAIYNVIYTHTHIFPYYNSIIRPSAFSLRQPKNPNKIHQKVMKIMKSCSPLKMSNMFNYPITNKKKSYRVYFWLVTTFSKYTAACRETWCCADLRFVIHGLLSDWHTHNKERKKDNWFWVTDSMCNITTTRESSICSRTLLLTEGVMEYTSII